MEGRERGGERGERRGERYGGRERGGERREVWRGESVEEERRERGGGRLKGCAWKYGGWTYQGMSIDSRIHYFYIVCFIVDK
jgi:hypothetical protein